MMSYGYGLSLQRKPELASISTIPYTNFVAALGQPPIGFEEVTKRYGTPMPALKDEYSRLLKAKTADTFSDGKTSFDYRKDRFASVLTHFSLPQDDQL